MTIKLNQSIKDKIASHGERAFPEECCGIMLGTIDMESDLRSITELIPMENTFASPESGSEAGDDTDTKKRRYLIDPKALFEAEKSARKQGLDVLGIYHSHPNHPSQASEFDRTHAMPFWSYVIVSILEGKRATMQSWRLTDDRARFEEESIVA